MHESRHQPCLNWLQDDLWASQGLMQRSAELTPVKANRYYGPRNHGTSVPHDFWELGTVITGVGDLLFDKDGAIALQPGVTFLIPPRVEHGENSSSDIDIIFIGLQGSFLEDCDYRTILKVNSRKLPTMMEEFWLRALGPGRLIGPSLDGLARTIAAEFVRCLDEPESDRETQRIEEVARLMRQRMAENIRVPDLARHMQCGPDYFRRIFKHHMGQTPNAYLAGLRMQHAMQLLEHSDLPIAQIARSSGYGDSFYFSRVFRRKTGCCPLVYRQRNRPS